MVKELSRSIREYKAAAILTPIFVSLEVVLECLIPFVTASLIDMIENNISLRSILPNALGQVVSMMRHVETGFIL